MPRLHKGRCRKFVPTKYYQERRFLEANLEAMYEVAMSICDPVMKDHICNHEDYEEFDNKQDTLGLLRIIKKPCTQMEKTTLTWAIIML